MSRTAPSGLVTFLFTDIEGSTRLWDAHPDAMAVALAEHDRILRDAMEEGGGFVFATGGDGFAAVFDRADDAVTVAQEAQEQLARTDWPDGIELRVRMGLHVGEAEERGGDYLGPAVNRAARIMDAGHGGQVVTSTTVADVVGSVEFRSLGHHRLRGFGAPDELWQLGPGEFPPLRSVQKRGNLPTLVSSFVGRTAERAEVVSLLDGARLITLVGPGGVGKTRLGIEAARDLGGDFADGAWFVDLAPRRDATAMIEATAAAVGVGAKPGEELRQTLLSHLAQRRALLVVDNCEHVLDSVATFCVDLLGVASGVTVLATSREPLGVTGEQVWTTPPLAQGRQLFVERAIQADAGFSPSAEQLEVIETVCARLDGIPLAIELAAARTRSMTVVEIRDALVDRFRLLRGSTRGGIERHQTMRTAVQWSVDQLEDEDRRLFEHLVVFPASFDTRAVEAVCGQVLAAERWDLRDRLAGLVERSLVMAADGGDATRFRLLETFRQFGEDRLDPESAATLRRAHLRYYTEVTADARITTWDLFDPQADPDIELWHLERDNIRAAMRWALIEHEPEVIERFADLTSGVFFVDSQVSAEVLEWAIEAAEDPAAGHVVVSLACVGTGWGLHGDFDAAKVMARRVIALEPTSSWGWAQLAGCRMVQGLLDEETADAARRSLEAAPERATDWHVTYTAIRAMALSAVDRPLADRLFDEARERVSDTRSPGAALAWGSLAGYATVVGDLANAVALCDRAIATAPDPTALPALSPLRQRAEALALMDDDRARPAFHRACEQYATVGWWAGQWRVLVALASWWQRTGRADAAARIAGCAHAHGIMVAGLDQLRAAVEGPDYRSAREEGRAMTPEDLLDHVIAELEPVALGGSLAS